MLKIGAGERSLLVINTKSCLIVLIGLAKLAQLSAKHDVIPNPEAKFGSVTFLKLYFSEYQKITNEIIMDKWIIQET